MKKFLYPSDTLWENDMAVMTLRLEGSTALFRLQESLHKLECLDVKRIYPGHGRPFTDVKRAISKSTEKIERDIIRRENGNLFTTVKP